MRLYVPVAAGLEAVVKRQLKTLGYDRAPASDGRLALEGDWDDVARLNVFLRSGERVLIEVGSFRASTFDELYDGARSLPWEEWLTPRSRIMMEGKSAKSALGAVKACGGVVKKAVLERLHEKTGAAEFPEDGPRTVVGVSIRGDEACLTVDTSGDGLHKRGYRCLPYAAPIKETLAAGLLDMTYYFPDRPFADLFCGSGTFPIEAAMRSRNIAPGRARSFDFERWDCAPEGASERAREEARDMETPSVPVDIRGSDINPRAVEISRAHAARAGVGDCIDFRVADAREFTSERTRGVLLSNPPYGERMGEREQVGELYRALGVVFRALPDWNAYIVTGFPGFERFFGRRADRVKRVYNANIECGFYSYLSSPPPRS